MKIKNYNEFKCLPECVLEQSVKESKLIHEEEATPSVK